MMPEDQATNAVPEVPSENAQETTESTVGESASILERIDALTEHVEQSNTPEIDQKVFKILVAKLSEAYLIAKSLQI